MERILPYLPPFTNFANSDQLRWREGEVCINARNRVIFTCLSNRAVHLEVANSLDTDACIHALQRFMSRRGQVCGLTMAPILLAQRELREPVAGLKHSKVQGALLQHGVKWSFNPPAALHYGGAWERVIRMIRKVLSSILHQQTLDDDGLHTVLCEVEAILNDRPITTHRISTILRLLCPITFSSWKANCFTTRTVCERWPVCEEKVETGSI